MDIGKSLSYVFEDKRWFTKLILGLVISLVPILNFAWAGYATKVVGNVEKGEQEPLPEWDEFGEKFLWGLYFFIAGFVYSLPIIILTVIFIVPAVFASESETWTNILIGSSIVYACVIGVYALVLSFFFPGANINLARKGTFGSLFQIGEIIKIFSTNTGPYFIAWVMTLILGLVISVVVGLVAGALQFIPCLGQVASLVILGLGSVYSSVVYAHLFGQAAAKQSLPA